MHGGGEVSNNRIGVMIRAILPYGGDDVRKITYQGSLIIIVYHVRSY